MIKPTSIFKLMYTVAWLCCSFHLSSQIIYVSANGSGNGDSWASATSLQNALALADTGTEIWVKAGVHYPTTCVTCSQFEREISFNIPSGVKMYGGFAGDETIISQRDPAIQITTLSGDIDGDGTHTNNSFTLVFTKNCSAETIIDGFTIRDANADAFASNDSNKHGGGWYDEGSGSNNLSAPRISNCVFINNKVYGAGGAVYLDGRFGGASSPVFTNCRFQNNEANLGGAIYANAREGYIAPELRRCRFIDNSASETGGAIYTFVRDATGTGSPLIINCLFLNNEAQSSGAVYSLGVGNGTAVTEIVNSTFYGNSAGVGGAVYTNASDGGSCEAFVRNCILWENTASFDNIFHYSGNNNPIIHLENSLVQANDCAELLGGTGSIDCQAGVLFNQNPVFVDAPNLNFSLSPTSPCINSGNNDFIIPYGESTDLNGATRIQDDNVDMGCFELGDNENQTLLISQQPVSIEGCLGMSAMFSITATGTPPLSYQWQKNETNIPNSNDDNLTINDLSTQDSGEYSCIVTDSNGQFLVSDIAELSVGSVVLTELTVSNTGLNICEGESVTFTASHVNGGVPYFIWRVNGIDIENENSAEFTLQNPNDGDIVQCSMLSSLSCASPSSTNSANYTVTVNDNLPVFVNITASQQSICAGETVIFGSDVTNGGTNPSFAWRLNGEIVSNEMTYSTDQLAPGNSIICEVSVANSCNTQTYFSNSLSISVQPLVSPEISVQTASTTRCAGEQTTFSAISLNGGENPSYSWKINGEMVAEGLEFSTSSLNNADIISCEMTSNASCTTQSVVESAPIAMTILPLANPAVSINATATSICYGGSVTFSATISDGGENPDFTWFVNGSAQNDNSSTLSLSGITEFTTVQLQMETSAACASNLFAFSEAISINISEAIIPSVSLTADDTSFCESEENTATITATTNAPADSYVFYVNGAEMQNSSENTFLFDAITNEDVISCTTHYTSECLTSPTAESNEIAFTVFELPVVSLSPFEALCHNIETINLEGGLPLGGIYSGNDFIENEQFSPANAGIGLHTITYSFTDENNCTNSVSEEVEVKLCSAQDEKLIVDVRVFPTPFVQDIYVNAENIKAIKLFNTIGQLVSTRITYLSNNQAKVQAATKTAGIYFLEIQTDKGYALKKIVKQ